MKNLPANLVTAKNSLDVKYPWLLLFELQLNDAEDRVVRLVRDYQDLAFLTEKYYETGCVRHFKCDETSGTVVTDASGNANGTASRDVSNWTVSGKVDKAFSLTYASSDYVDCGNGSDIQFEWTDPFSIVAWCKTDSETVTRGVVAKMDATTARRGYRLSWYDGQVYFVVCHDFTDGNNRFYVRTKTQWNDDQWHLVVVTYDGSGKAAGAKIYVDGIEQELYIDRDALDGTIQNSVNLRIGADESGIYWDGELDNALIFNKELTDDEQKLLYNAGNGTAKLSAQFKNFNFSLGLIRQSSEGDLPTVSLSVSNISLFLQSFLEETDYAEGGIIRVTIVHVANLYEDYAELELDFDILNCKLGPLAIVFQIGGPSPLRRPFPLWRYFADFCQCVFEDARCQYSRKTVADVILSGSDPVKIQVNSHGFSTGNVIRLADINGITPSLAGNWTITKVDTNNFTLDGTDSSDYSGSYTSGGTAGYATCNYHLDNCRERQNSIHFRSFLGLRGGSVRFA